MSESELDLSPAGLAAQARELAPPVIHGELHYEIAAALTAVRDAARAESRVEILGLEAENRELRKPFDDVVRVLNEKHAEEVRQLREALRAISDELDDVPSGRAQRAQQLADQALAATEPSHG